MVFMILILLAMFMACGKESARRTGYCVLALASLILLLAATGFLFWIFGVAEGSGFCGALREVNRGNLEIMTDRDVSPDFVNFVERCVLQ